MTRARRLLLSRTSETEWQDTVLDVARAGRWRWYHTHDSRRSPEGFPDLVLVRPPRMLVVELKTEAGRLSPAQVAWRAELERCPGVEYHLWRPSDLDEVVETLRPAGVVVISP